MKNIMRMKIAHDARPQARTLLVATLVTLALWFLPYTSFLTYPFRLFVTFIHEGGHALAAVLTGSSVRSLSVAIDTSGLTETLTPQGGFFSRFFISSAGYLGTIAFGALLLWLVRRKVKARVVLIGSAAIILGLTVVFGFIAPLTNLSLQPFTVISGVAIAALLLAAAKYFGLRAANFLVGFLAVQCVLNAVFDLKNVLWMSVASDAPTDAMNMAQATGVPAIFWSLIWIVIACLLLTAAMRAYAVGRSRPSQPDLPFEDPLEV
ncbi:MAG TPA: M50 family metallopeptidase [Pyrinomonadaceae bacterium]|nr:M50 family metallopeptidase [Pyrinomonadaceae bacterium]